MVVVVSKGEKFLRGVWFISLTSDTLLILQIKEELLSESEIQWVGQSFANILK